MNQDRANRLAELKSRGGIVKIDGVRELEHALAAAQAGADLIGFIFAKARRQVSPVAAAQMISGVREAFGERAPLFLGVFVDESPDRINVIAAEAGLDLVQLHGHEPIETMQAISVPVFRSIGPAPEATVQSVLADMASKRIDEAVPAQWVLDAWDPVNHGGTGKRADWTLAAGVAREVQLFLAGGLNPENVASAIEAVRPAGVDVSSGVETDGVKDSAKVRAFVERARLAFERIQT